MKINNKELTILQVIPQLVSGGAERTTIDVAKSIIEKGHKSIVVSSGGRMVREFNNTEIIYIELPVHSKSLWTILLNIKRIYKVIKEYNVDIIHSRSRAPAWSAYYAGKKAGIKIITTYHGLYGENNYIKKIYNKVMVKGDAVIAVSDFISNNIKSRYKNIDDKITVIKRGIDLKYFSNELVTTQRKQQLIQNWGLADDLRNVILLPGRITRIKGHEILIEAVKILSTKRQDFICVCPGDIHSGKNSYANEIINMIKKYNLENYFLFPGACLDMPAAYAISNIITSPSAKPESFGRIPIESQIMGKPIVASRHGGYCETIVDKKSGFLFEPNNSVDLSDKLDKALNLDEKNRFQMASFAEEYIKENFSVKKMCNKVIGLYESI